MPIIDLYGVFFAVLRFKNDFCRLNKICIDAQYRSMDKTSKTPERIAWDLFEKTGNPSYYMLYKKLKGLQEPKL